MSSWNNYTFTAEVFFSPATLIQRQGKAHVSRADEHVFHTGVLIMAPHQINGKVLIPPTGLLLQLCLYDSDPRKIQPGGNREISPCHG